MVSSWAQEHNYMYNMNVNDQPVHEWVTVSLSFYISSCLLLKKYFLKFLIKYLDYMYDNIILVKIANAKYM